MTNGRIKLGTITEIDYCVGSSKQIHVYPKFTALQIYTNSTEQLV